MENNNIATLAEIEANEYTAKHGTAAPKMFLLDLPLSKHTAEFIRLVVDALNRKHGGDNEIVQCVVCSKYSMWGGFENDATFWSCEQCGCTFCDDCAHVDNENDEQVLCNVCRDTGDKNDSENEESKSQIVVIKDRDDDDILFVLEVTNYDNADSFGAAVKIGRANYEQQEENENGLYPNDLHECILAALENYGYDYEFTGFEVVKG